ncbi:hypothetical protein UlMin_025424 [Ulmus minor]
MEKSNNKFSNTSYKVLTKNITTICIPINRNFKYRGIFLGDNPFDFVYPTFMAKIIAMTLLSQLLYFVLRPLKQTKFVCYFLGGFILGPSLLGQNETINNRLFPEKDREMFVTISMLAPIYHLFLMGVKMDVSLIIKLVKTTWRVGIFGAFLCPLVVSTTLFFTLCHAFPGGTLKGVFMFYVPLTLSYTFFPSVTEALEELNLWNFELSQIAMSSAALNDIVFWFLSTMAVALLQDTKFHSIQAFTGYMTFILFTYLVIRPLIHMILKTTPEGKPIKELYVIILLVGVLVMSCISDAMGWPIFGAAITGIFIPAGPPLGAALVQKTECILSELFMPLYILRIGHSINIKSIVDWNVFIKFQITLVMGYFAKVAGVVLAAYSCGIRLKHGLLLSAMMNIKGILELFLFHRWQIRQLITDQIYCQLVLSTVGMTMIMTPLVHYLKKPLLQLNLSLKHYQGHRTIQSTPSNSEFRILSCIHNEESVYSIINLIEASNPTQSSPICAYIVHASNLIGLAAPILVPYDNGRRTQRLAFSPNTDRIIRAFENFAINSRGPVIVKPFIMVTSYKSMHENICCLARDKRVPLILLPFHRNQRFSVNSVISTAIQNFNVNVQHSAPCTVGILVDMGFSRGKISNKFSYHIAVVFIGGPDDREALSYVSRMSGRENLRITGIRIILRNKKEMSDDEKRELCFNESIVDEFKLRTMGDSRVSWNELEAVDAVEVMTVVRSLEGEFDLVVVGRRQKEIVAAMGEEEMLDFVENLELGVIGDMLSSPDFCGGKVSVLVMQQCRETESSSNQNKISASRNSSFDKLLMFPRC